MFKKKTDGVIASGFHFVSCMLLIKDNTIILMHRQLKQVFLHVLSWLHIVPILICFSSAEQRVSHLAAKHWSSYRGSVPGARHAINVMWFSHALSLSLSVSALCLSVIMCLSPSGCQLQVRQVTAVFFFIPIHMGWYIQTE